MTGTVTAKSGLNIRSGPSKSKSKIGGLSNGASVEILESSNGWYKIRSGSTSGWVSAQYVKTSGSETTAQVSATDATPVATESSTPAASSSQPQQEYTTGEDWSGIAASVGTGPIGENMLREYYAKLTAKYGFAMGAPPKYNMDIDVQYDEETVDGIATPGWGRVMNKTFLSNPSIMSLMPGTVRMFPNLIGSARDSFIEQMINVANGDSELLNKISQDSGGAFSGKLYQWEPATKDYTLYLNALCRACSILMGIGDQLMPNTSSKLKNFDYSYWTIRKRYDPTLYNATSNKSIFGTFASALAGVIGGVSRAVTASVDESSYINFFMNGSDTQVSESISTDVTESPLENIFSTVTSFASQLNYFTNSGFAVGGENVGKLMEDALGGSQSPLGGIINLGQNFLKGGRMILPKMVNGASYSRSISCNMKFISPYGHPLSVFLRCIVPICHLLALALPRQLSDNMYTYPFLVRGAQAGCFVMDCGVMHSINIVTGGSDDTSWTVGNLPTEWEVQIELMPLVDDLMITSTEHPVLFCKNENLLDYLANFCGFDVLAYNQSTKWDLMRSFVLNNVMDIPNTIHMDLRDRLYKKLNAFGSYHW